MEKINLTINGIAVEAIKGETIMKAAERAGIKIPRLCYTEMHNTGVTIKPVTCRVCEVEISGGKVMAACVAPVKEGLEVHTNSKLALEARRGRLEAILANHPPDCLTCERNLACELQTLAVEMGIRKIPAAAEDKPKYEIDCSNPSLVRDQNKCILCRRCDAVCSKVQAVNALECQGKGAETMVKTKTGAPLGDTGCVLCGLCAAVCPTAAIAIKDDTQKAWDALHDPDKYVIVQIAPAVRSGIGQMFGLQAGDDSVGRLNAALRRLGFDKVLNTNFAADLTIMEEGTELIKRVTKGGVLPMITSCCPGWVKFAEHKYPDLLPHLSSCKSPQQMFGAVAKTWLPTKLAIDPSRIFSVSIMPCTAKKYEAQREEMAGDIDVVLTTQEIGKMIKEAAIDFVNLPDEEFDQMMGEESGAGAIFGVTGGVCEAALRTVYEIVNQKKLENVEFIPLRGFEGSYIKEATVDLNVGEGGAPAPVKVAVSHELRNAAKLMEQIRAGESPYTFIEIMACPGGCVNGGGQPYCASSVDTINKRSSTLYNSDKHNIIRRSHDNEEVKKLYDDYLGEPYYGEKAYELLHTKYKSKPVQE
ncbi:MAG: [FeFe] hydrogenase, group A [Clostridiales bacterium]|jgi:iron-only hydrogenase group A|nr:[FeFe] hydrogenase, group A [Clostridiales bacterium]